MSDTIQQYHSLASRTSMLALAAVTLLTASSVATLSAQSSAPTSLTLYNDGRVLVRRLLPLEIRKGDSEQRVALGPVDPASVFTLDSTVSIIGSAYDGSMDYASTMRRALGRRLTFRTGKDTVSAELVGIDPERYKLADGTITFERPGSPQFPADLVLLEPALRLSLSSAQARKELALAYFTQGGGWYASYQAVITGGSVRMSGQAVVNGGLLRVKDAELQLLAGQVNVAEVRQESRMRAEGFMVAKAASNEAMPSQEKVGEFHLYTLPGRASLEPGIITTVGLFPPAAAKVRKSFEVLGQIPYWGGLAQYGNEDEVPVNVTYTVQRPRKTDLGDRPLPAGVVRLFEPDSAGRLQLIGEAAIDHSPAGEDLRLGAGTAFDLTAKRIQTTFVTKRDSAGGTWRTIATADYKVTLTNAGDAAVSIDVIEQRGGEWSVIASSVKPVKVSSTRTSFPVSVPARGKTTLTYRVRVVW